ncbi:hypothetical protein [Microbacterium testaceum]|uniref:hypothetical protein n=1 Tax=Microbacterium testaceum TaxID=2033 RepID=UPI002AC439B9|nr:hypothetical protein [Microbacterium testaceum]MDZ5146352.1 hypothetical protein [Microbacterium testaceum]
MLNLDPLFYLSAPSSMIDIPWEGVPNWISAGASILTLFAAVAAAIFAGRAAHWTKQQATAAAAQTTTADEQLKLARDGAAKAQMQLEKQQQDATRAERRQSEARLDGIAPVVLATARRHNLTKSSDGEPFQPVAHRHEVDARTDALFRTSATITFRNLSDKIARVDITHPAHGELSIRSGEGIILSPGERKEVEWQRTIARAALRSEEDLGKTENWWMTVEIWVRDLGMNVRDTFRFGGDFRHFSLDGSRLIVDPELPFPWEDNVAEPTSPRIYERLDAGLAGISPAS